jgi:hypothetical protein
LPRSPSWSPSYETSRYRRLTPSRSWLSEPAGMRTVVLTWRMWSVRPRPVHGQAGRHLLCTGQSLIMFYVNRRPLHDLFLTSYKMLYGRRNH